MCYSVSAITAVVATTVGVVVVGVITGLVRADNTVATCSGPTGVRAIIGVVAVGIIAGLAWADDPVSASCYRAVVGAVVCVFVVSVIAILADVDVAVTAVGGGIGRRISPFNFAVERTIGARTSGREYPS